MTWRPCGSLAMECKHCHCGSNWVAYVWLAVMRWLRGPVLGRRGPAVGHQHQLVLGASKQPLAQALCLAHILQELLQRKRSGLCTRTSKVLGIAPGDQLCPYTAVACCARCVVSCSLLQRRRQGKRRYLLPEPPRPGSQSHDDQAGPSSSGAAAAAGGSQEGSLGNDEEPSPDQIRPHLRSLGDSVTSAVR
jgi:hypothetical protein